MVPFRVVTLCCLVLVCGVSMCGQSPRPAVEILIINRTGEALSGVKVQATGSDATAFNGETDAKGHIAFPQVTPSQYLITLTKDGFEPLQIADVALGGPSPTTMELMMFPALARHEMVEVKETIDPVGQGASAPAELSAKTAKDIRKPGTVADALPLLPGIVRTPAGDLQISGTG